MTLKLDLVLIFINNKLFSIEIIFTFYKNKTILKMLLLIIESKYYKWNYYF